METPLCLSLLIVSQDGSCVHSNRQGEAVLSDSSGRYVNRASWQVWADKGRTRDQS